MLRAKGRSRELNCVWKNTVACSIMHVNVKSMATRYSGPYYNIYVLGDVCICILLLCYSLVATIHICKLRAMCRVI